jgi:hypothetical protein
MRCDRLDPSRLRYQHGSDHIELGVCIEIDIVRSRALTPVVRRATQDRLRAFVHDLTTLAAPAGVRLPFQIMHGDNAVALMRSASAIPDILWLVADEWRPPGVELRMAVSAGEFSTTTPRLQHGSVVGPLCYAMDVAMRDLRRIGRHDGVFRGFGPDMDAALTGYAALLTGFRQGLTEAQRAVVRALRVGTPQRTIAAELGLTKQAISRRASQAHWTLFREAEAGFRAACALAVPMRGSMVPVTHSQPQSER